MKRLLFLLMLSGGLVACARGDNTYITHYVEDGCDYEYSIIYPDGIDYATVERYAAFDIAGDNVAIVVLMDSLVRENKHLDFWCYYYYNAMKETIPYDSILPKLISVMEREPSNPTVYSSIGYTYHHLGDNLRAIEYINKGSSVAPHDEGLWFGLGVVEMRKGDTLAAKNSFQRSFEFAKKHKAESTMTLSEFMIEQLK